MRIRALLTATALVASSVTSMTPAFAAVGDPVTDPVVQAALNQYCNTLVPPDDTNPPFEVTAINAVEGETTPGGLTTITLVVGSEHRHGGSPNIFEDAHETTSGGSTSYSFDCQTYNPNAGSAQGQYPEGLQFSGQTTILPNTSGSSTDTDVVVCNSPTKNPGVWRAQNGYLGNCATEGSVAVFYSLPIYSAQTVWEPIPSNSYPG
jgi:hypothetical protein